MAKQLDHMILNVNDVTGSLAFDRSPSARRTSVAAVSVSAEIASARVRFVASDEAFLFMTPNAR